MNDLVGKCYSAVILAAGSGRRMISWRNKMFLTLNGKAIFQYALDLFLSDSDCQQIILVGKSEEKVHFENFLSDRVQFIVGGAERQDSVRNALSIVKLDYVMIHDGARPFVRNSDLSALKSNQNAILAVPVKETIKQADVSGNGKIIRTVPRKQLWVAQTPQFFETNLIRNMHDIAYKKGFLGTDDASLIEQFSEVPVTIIPGTYENIKITTPEDLIFGRMILENRSDD
jgi:2-C-methyl-D-erythritol 4-phosphate cytidylyltransferase